MRVDVEKIQARDLRAGDVIDTHSGLDLKRDGLSRWWRKICSVQVRSEWIEIQFDSGQVQKCTTGYLFDKQVITGAME